MNKEKEVCRLCYNENADTVDIFVETGEAFNYKSKITKYLYLSVSADDLLPNTVCWMCAQNLDSFHRFYEKINEIQKNILKNDYEKFSLIPNYEKLIDNSKSLGQCETVCDEDGNVYEVFIDTEGSNIDMKAENEIEEYELLEVDVGDSVDNYKGVQPIESLPVVDDGGEELTKNDQSIDVDSPTYNIRRSRRIQRPAKVPTRQLIKKSFAKKKKPLKTEEKEIDENSQQYDDDIQEGDSDNDFPARNSEDEDWPSQMTLNEFPKEIIKDGLLLMKGKQLMSMICRFYNLECKLCRRKHRFKELGELFQHYTIIHQEPGYVECCQTKLIRYPAIIMHMARHLQPEAFKCDECGYVVTRPRFLKSHKQTHLPENEKPYGCNECSRRFCWKSALRIHAISHQPANERKQYVCPICERSYDTPGGLSTHKKLVHSGTKPSQSNVCHLCAKSFATRTGLQEHMVTIHQPREKGQVQCNECGKWLMNQRCLKTHMILHSNIELRCDQCDYVTKKTVLLNRHLVTQHSNHKPFACDLCGRAFKMKRALTVHVAQHGTNKQYQCPFCDRKFNSSTNFYTHRKNSHPKELANMKRQEEEIQRQKRIAAGVEVDN